MRLAGLKVNSGYFLSEYGLIFAVRGRDNTVWWWCGGLRNFGRELLLPQIACMGRDDPLGGETSEPDIGLAFLMAERVRKQDINVFSH